MTGARIRAVREREGLTQTAFAARIGFSRATIGRVEKGSLQSSEKFITAVAEKFDVSLVWLRSGEGEMRRNEKEADRRTIGERMSSQRKEQLLSQDDLAHKVGCSRTQISLIESNRSHPSAGMIERIATALEVNSDWLRTGRGKTGREDFAKIYDALKDNEIARKQVYEWLKRNFNSSMEEGKEDEPEDGVEKNDGAEEEKTGSLRSDGHTGISTQTVREAADEKRTT